ncbi:MAG: homoserine O-succinyltransferase [Bacteroidetes bacterium]|nr:homoserine O-succinyltransferase [Bacteroidota bacterium]
MSVVLPKHHHARQTLESRGVLCISDEEAQRADIRPLRIGILNIMPKGETYEPYLLYPLSRTIIQIEPVWIRLRTHQYKSTDKEHLERNYSYFDDAIKNVPLDGLLVTGAPVEEIEYEQVTYWSELTDIFTYARSSIYSTVGICWGGLALAKMLGIDKVLYPYKVFGVFETRNLNRAHPITGDMDDIFWCPQSRHSGILDSVLEEEALKGTVHLLAHATKGGYVIFESSDRRFLMHLGHPEYEAQRLVEEYTRDMSLGRTDVLPPENLDIEKPINRWRSHGLEFFAQWVRYIYEPTSIPKI